MALLYVNNKGADQGGGGGGRGAKIYRDQVYDRTSLSLNPAQNVLINASQKCVQDVLNI